MCKDGFVGRVTELDALRRAFAAEGPQIVYLHGPGGVGKSSLLLAFAHELRTGGVGEVHFLDARDFEATRAGLARALDAAGVGNSSPRSVVILDTYDLLASLEPLVIRDLLRRVDDDTLLVLGTRAAPSAEWRALSLWGRSIHGVALRNLSPGESAAYLERRGVDADAAASIAAFAHGHPLALAIAADAWAQMPSSEFRVDLDLGVITALYDYFARGIQDPAQRTILEVAAILPAVTEAALLELVGPGADGRFDWLRALCFVESGPRGLYPHDLAREVILAELRWRNTARLATLVQRALQRCAAIVEAAPPEAFTCAFADFAFILSHNPRARVLMVSPDTGLTLDVLRPDDTAVIEAVVGAYEGVEEAARARHWLARQPGAFSVARRDNGEVAGLIGLIRLDLATDADRHADPLALAAWEHALTTMGAALDRPIAYTRYFMSCARHQESDPAMALCSQAVGPVLFTPEFALLYTRMHGWEHWGETARLCAAEEVPSLAHESGGKRFLVTVQDQRGLTGVQWMARFCERTTIADWRLVEPLAVVDASLSALSRDDFRARLRDALRALHDPLVLARNPLIHCHVVQRRVDAQATAGARARALRDLLCEQIEALGGSPRGDAWRQVMTAAYIEPGGKHEAIARAMAMSYSSFRRVLGAATEHITDVLWAGECS